MFPPSSPSHIPTPTLFALSTLRMASSPKEELKSWKKKLKKATSENSAQVIINILDNLSKYTINEEILKETRIGKSVGKLRKHENKEIAAASKKLVSSWKETVDNAKNEKKEDTNGVENNKREREEETKVVESEAKKPKTEEPKVEEPAEKSTQPRKVDTNRSEDRKKICELLSQALGEPKPSDFLSTNDTAFQIEEELFSIYGGVTREYKAKFRSLSFNLKKNPDLRSSLMEGSLSCQVLCKMTPQEMASEELKKERQKISEYHLEAAKLSNMNQTSTDMFKCGKCGKRETSYYQMQTRSADEPMTTFHTCQNCGNRWKS